MLTRAPLRLLARPSTRPFTTTLLRPSSQDHKVSDGNIPVNDPKEPRSPANVSATNAVPTSTFGAQDEALVETPEDGERQRQLQAPNRKGTWARSQQERSKAMVGPRFEQTIMEFQVLYSRGRHVRMSKG
jgi:NADH dehydrogenase (ubiquinone) Fe-S protein 6